MTPANVTVYDSQLAVYAPWTGLAHIHIKRVLAKGGKWKHPAVIFCAYNMPFSLSLLFSHLLCALLPVPSRSETTPVPCTSAKESLAFHIKINFSPNCCIAGAVGASLLILVVLLYMSTLHLAGLFTCCYQDQNYSQR